METLEGMLDGRSWYDPGVAGEVMHAYEAKLLAALPQVPLLSSIILYTALGPTRARQILNFAKTNGAYPEISVTGARRCVYKNNERCCNYATKGQVVCNHHMNRAIVISPTLFRSPKLRETYNHYLTSKHKMSLDGELALLRTMLQALLSKVGDEVPFEIIVAATTLAEKISSLVERMSKMNAITPEAVDKMMSQVADVLAKYVDPLKLEQCSAEIALINPLEAVPVIEYVPEDTLTLVNEEGDETEVRIEAVKSETAKLIEKLKAIGVDPNDA